MGWYETFVNTLENIRQGFQDERIKYENKGEYKSW